MSSAGLATRAISDIAAVVGRDYVTDDVALLAPLAIDGVVPHLLVTPATPEEIASVFRIANEKNLVVAPYGGATRQTIGAIPERIDIALSTARLNAVESYDPGDLTICLGAGARVADVEALVASNRQVLPLDVASAEHATIGGVLASGDFGPLKHGFGGVREFCIGVNFVSGDARLGKGGGRVVKNVAGYDMMKLLIGSHGTLGVITYANFKLFPAARQTCTFAASFAKLSEAIAFRDFVVRSPLTPLTLELISPRAHAYVRLGSADRWTVLVRAGGTDNVLARYRRELGSAITKEFTGDDELALWRSIRNYAPNAAQQHATLMLMEVHLPASEALKSFDSAEQVASDENFLFLALGRCAVASLLFAFVPLAVDPPPAMQYVSAISALRASLPRDGAAVVTRCPSEVKRHVSVWGTSTNDLAAMQSIKRALDANNVLNRGRFLF